jgi:hypothetical protein
MATITSDKIASGTNKLLPLGYNQSIMATAAVTTALATNDIVQMMYLSSDASLTSGDGNSTGGPTILGVVLGVDPLDTGTALLLDVGDVGSSTRFISGATIGRSSTGGRVAGTTASCLGYKPFGTSFTTYTTPSLQTYLIQVKVNTQATTAVAGSIRLLVDFTIDP